MENKNTGSDEGSKKSSITDSKKMTFLLGFFSGLALISVLGFFILLGLLFSGKEDVNLGAAQAEGNGEVVDNTAPTDEAPTIAVRPISEDDHYKGDLKAPVQLIIYNDFECPYCGRHEDTVKQIQKEYGNKIVVAMRHFPLSFHSEAQKAAEASECAAEQGKFWEMHDMLFEDQGNGIMSVEQFKKNAATIGLNVSKFNECLDSGKYEEKIADEMSEGATFGVRGTPGNFINGQSISGAVPFEQFKVVIDSILN